MTEPAVPDLLAVDVPLGGRVLVISDLHLGPVATAESSAATVELARAIEAWTGPGLLVFNGSCLELLCPGPVAGLQGRPGPVVGLQGRPGPPDPRASLAAYPHLTTVVRAFAAGPGRRVVYLAGATDGRVAWDRAGAAAVRTSLGAELALAAELTIDTGAGPRTVRVEPGHRLDPLMRVDDPFNPAESPLGHHLMCEVLPALSASTARRAGRLRGRANAGGGTENARRAGPDTGDGWLSGLDSLDDPASFPRFLASRLTYRRLGRHAWVLALPLVAAVLLRLPFAVVQRAHEHVASAARVAVFLVLATVLGLLLVGTVVALLVRGTWRALAGVALSQAGKGGPPDLNGVPRALARDLVTAGHAGLITGHTRHPELTYLGTGFYANTGCAAEVVSESPARLEALGAPSLFLAHRQVSWIEIEAGNDLHVRLLHARRDLPGATVLERLLARRPAEAREVGRDVAREWGGIAGADHPGHPGHPVVVATFPHSSSWPAPVAVDRKVRRIRRWASGLVAAAGVLSLVSAFLEPMRERLTQVLEYVPLAVPEAANALVALGALGLLFLARSIRRGQRRAWLIAEALLAGTLILHLIKGFDVEAAAATGLVGGYLLFNRDAFRAGVDKPSTHQGILTLAWGAVLSVVIGTGAVELGTRLSGSRHHQRLPLPQAFMASTERLLGLHSVRLPERLDDFFSPAMLAIAIGLGLAVAYLLSRPVVARHVAGSATSRSGSGSGSRTDAGDLAAARDVVRRFGSGTLDYFALRSDKEVFFWGDSVVAYGVYGGVSLVSPDPIGPRSEREEVWKAFSAFADGQGWTLAVMGAGEEWLPIYRATGMHDLYLGDEAVVDCTRFTLDGGKFKGLRQAVNRVAKYGYTITFHDPSMIEPEMRAQLEAVMTRSRRGDVERGFSMTLGRAFDASDDGLLLAVVWGPPAGPGGQHQGPAGLGGQQQGPGGIEPVAFCQYVPAPGINGYSLDLMRRDNGEHPNGLLDFAVVETIRHLAAEGKRGLGLNFATMRAVLAGELGEGLSQRIQAWMLRRMSDSMQIESLWKFNAKFDPEWQPRYALYDSPEHALAALVAVARAESFWELPLIGRFLVPSAPAVPVPAVLVPAGSNGSASNGAERHSGGGINDPSAAILPASRPSHPRE